MVDTSDASDVVEITNSIGTVAQMVDKYSVHGSRYVSRRGSEPDAARPVSGARHSTKRERLFDIFREMIIAHSGRRRSSGRADFPHPVLHGRASLTLV
jgi:IMP dehydrogenase/GMP reductase